jgi:hypothetical protein
LDYQILTSLAIILATLAVLSFSGVVIYSHKVTAYEGVRKILVGICILLGARAGLEAIKFSPNFSSLAMYYSAGDVVSVTLVLVALTATALGIYFDSSKANFSQLISIIQSHKRYGLIMEAAAVYIAGIIGLLVTRPYSIVYLREFSGGRVLSVVFKQSYQLYLIPAVALIVCYAAPLVFSAAGRTKDKGLANSLRSVSISWVAIGVIFVVLNLFQNLGRVDMSGLLYFIFAALFSFTALGFNKASLLAGFIEYKSQDVIGTSPASFPFSRNLNKDSGYASGKTFLLESDVAGSLETPVRDFCIEQLSLGESVFVVTNISSPLYRALSRFTDIRFCLFTQRVNRPQPGEKENEILIPQDGITTVLDVIEKVSGTTGAGRKISLVIDNLTDVFVTLGTENAQKFLRTANEFMAYHQVTVMFIVYPEGLDIKVVNWIRSLYGNILSFSARGLKPLKELD